MLRSPIRKVLIVGGTHGNERTGVFLVQKWQQHPELLAREGLVVDTLLANPEAIQQNRRYLDKDLNRCFSDAVLADTQLKGYELERAQHLYREIGKGDHCRYDLIIDLHTSTAEMRTNLVLTKHDQFHFDLVQYMQQANDSVVITSEAELIPDHHFLCALAKHNLVVEVGPVPQGVLRHETITETETAVVQILDFIETWNRTDYQVGSGTIEAFCYTGKIFFPQNDAGEITAVLHPAIEGSDYQAIESDAPLFISRTGETIRYDGPTTHLSFINEAAYYDQSIACCTLEPRTLTLNVEA